MPLTLVQLDSNQQPHPLLAPYFDLKSEAVRSKELAGMHDVFLAESELTVRQLLASDCGVQSLLTTAPHWAKLERAVHARRQARAHKALADEDTVVFLASEAALQDVVGFAFHRGVLAAGVRPAPRSLDEMLSCDTLTLLEGLSNYDNVGAVFRNVACLAGDAASAPGVILGPGCCDPLYRKAIRVSIGHVLATPFATAQQLVAGDRRDCPPSLIWPGLLHTLRASGWRLLAMTPAGTTTLQAERARRQSHPHQKVAVLVGAEGPGLTPQAMQACDACVAIPMREGIDSLNVATALAVAWSWLR